MWVAPLIYNDKLIGLVTVIYDLDDLLSIFQTYEGLGKTGEINLVKKNNNGWCSYYQSITI